MYTHRLLIDQGPGSGLNFVKSFRGVIALPGPASTAIRTALVLPTFAVPVVLKITVAIKLAVGTKLVRTYPACLHLVRINIARFLIFIL